MMSEEDFMEVYLSVEARSIVHVVESAWYIRVGTCM